MEEEDDAKPGPSKPPEEASNEARTLSDILNDPENKGGNLVVPLPWCPHLEEASKLERDSLPDLSLDDPCLDCQHQGENWLCLTCGEVRCSRYVKEHMLFHRLDTQHNMSISFSDLSVWCYVCESYIDNFVLYNIKNKLHVLKFGEEMPKSNEIQHFNLM